MSQLWKMNDEKPVTIPLGKGNFNTHVNSNGGDGWFFNDWQLTRSDSAIPDKRYGFNIELWSDDKCLKKTELQYSDLAINSLCSNYQAEKLTVKETITCVGNGENRKITIKNISKHTVTTTLKSKFEPTLLPQSDSNNNPRFNDFFIRTKKIKNGLKFNRLHKNITLIHRLTKVNKNKNISWYNDLESKKILESTPYPVAVCEIDLSLEPGESTTLIFETKAKLINQTLGSKKGKFLKFYPLTPKTQPHQATNLASLLKHYDPPLPRSSRSQSVRDLWNLQLNPNSPLLTLEIGEKLSLSEALDIFFLVKKLNEQHFLCDLIVIASTSGQERTFQPFVKNNRFLRVLQNKNINDSLQKALQTSSDLYLDRTIPNYQNLSLSPSIEPTFPDKLILKQPPYKFSGDDFIFEINTGTQPRRPWVNILANHQFGTLIHHSGQSYTWYKNSTELSITKADRDLYNFQGGEGLFLQQGENLISLFQVEKTNVLYNPNKSTFETTINQCRYRQSITIDNKEPAKLVSLEITNNSSEIKEITIAHRWNLALGNGDPDISVSHTNDYRRTTIINHTHQDFSQIINCVVETNHVVTADFYHDQLIKKVSIILEPGKTTTFNFLTFINDFDYSRFKSLEAPIKNLIIDTPDNYQDNLFNTWLLPQSLHSRLFGRLGFYQPSGAYGFRDQLQDVMALVYSDPALMREHIIRSAGWVTENGNAFNWWYESSNFGSIRRFTDHQIWLLIAVADYVEKTSDIDILDTEVGFKIIPIELDFIDKKNWVGIPEQSATTRSLASLITIIINFCLDNIGEHGLLKHGQSDWNDGFNNVGQQGRGESIWSTMAFTRSLKALLPLATYLEQTTTDELEKHIKSLEAAIEKNGKGEKYYYRSYDDNGQILGQPNSHLSIASLTQSWATLGNIGDQSFNNQALQIAFNELVTTDYILLYKTNSKIPKIDLGYIQDYPIGTREHLAQYNHAALWFAQALLKAGFNNQGYQLLNLINPAYLSEKRGFNYGAEPYAVTADIFGPDSPKAGSAGWSWYTGSAGVYYVTLVEYLFGIKYSKLGDQITIKPSFPSYWNQASITIYNLTLNFVRDSNLEFNTLHTSEPSFNNATSTISISGLTTGQIINFTFN